MSATFSTFATAVQGETAFTVLAVAKRLIAAGKNIVELEVGDSPFPTSPEGFDGGIRALTEGQTHYGASAGLPEFRSTAAEYVNQQYNLAVSADNIVVGPGAKVFEQFFCEAFVESGDGVLVFSPHFPTYPANIHRRGGRMVISKLRASHDFRPSLDDVERFLTDDPKPKAIFLNSPHNPTGGVATLEDLEALASLIRGKDIAVFSDEPYDAMVWQGQHHTLLGQPGMFDQCLAAYTFSKSFSMSGWRLGYSVSSVATAEILTVLANTSLSCVPPFTQQAGIAAMRRDGAVRDERMADFQRKVTLLVTALNQLDDFSCVMPKGTFYVFPSVKTICNRYNITSHGLALFLLEAADDDYGVACLGGECFGDAGGGFLRLSCAEPDARLQDAVTFIGDAVKRESRIEKYLASHPEYRLSTPNVED